MKELQIQMLVVVLLTIMSCSTKSNLDDSSEKQNIKEFDVDDPRVLRAKKVAQDSMSYYIDYFRRFYGQENYKFFLKSAISDSNGVEHMWLKPFSLDDNGFNCILDNEPMTITNHKLGDTIQIRLSDIEDVIIVTADTTIIGHYFEKELKKYQRSETGPGREQ